MTFTLSRRPAEASASITFLCTPIVVVRSADSPTICASCSAAVATNRSTGTSTPRSWTSNPFAESIVPTSVFPISWMSPWTVPMTTFARRAGDLVPRAQLRLEHLHRLLHARGRHDQVRQEILAGRELVPDDAHPGDEALVENHHRLEPGLERLSREVHGGLPITVHEARRDLYQEIVCHILMLLAGQARSKSGSGGSCAMPNVRAAEATTARSSARSSGVRAGAR